MIRADPGRRLTEPRAVRWLLTSVAVLFLTLFIILPAANVFVQAFAKGAAAYAQTFKAPAAGDTSKLPLFERRRVLAAQAQAAKTQSAIRMTFGVALFAVPLNVIFGVAAAWTLAKFRFRGRALLLALIDLPFSVSPVIAGLVFILLFGRLGLFGRWVLDWQWPDPASLHWRGFTNSLWPLDFTHHFEGVIFSPAAIVMTSIFVTFPLVARSLIPLMEAQGVDQELAARTLGASGWRVFWRVTLPNVKWALLYGVILCTARVCGEFGAVSVVSGHTDANDTMPLRIEKLWNEYNNQSAFAVASLLALLAIITLVVRVVMERRNHETVTARSGWLDRQQP